MATTGAPSPSGKGYQVRLYEQIVRLAPQHEITLLTFGSRADLDPRLLSACHKVLALPWSRASAARRALMSAHRLPLSVGLYRNPAMAAAVASELASARQELVHLSLVRMGPYLAEAKGLPVVLDLLDASELNMRERAKTAPPGIRSLLEMEASRLGSYELASISRATISLFISQRDRSYAGEPPRTRTVPNGVDRPELGATPPDRAPATVIFSGTMSYFPNVDAARWFADAILPRVQAAVPAAGFRIVGRDPAASILRLSERPGVKVTGAVPLIHQEIARASVSVCPLRLGSGLQTKVLEAMAVGTPVVATSKAVEGLPQDLVPYLVVADAEADLAAAIAEILNHPGPAQQRAADGLKVIGERHQWQDSVDQLEDCYAEAIATARTS